MAYQVRDGENIPVEMAYVLSDTSELDDEARIRYGFELGLHDPALPLVLDPAVLIYTKLLGAWEDASGTAIAVDAAGNAYITGYTEDRHFSVTVGPDMTRNGWYDAFVAKLNAAGTELISGG